MFAPTICMYHYVVVSFCVPTCPFTTTTFLTCSMNAALDSVEHIFLPDFTIGSYCVGFSGEQHKHMHMQYTSVPSSTHTNWMNDTPALHEILMKFHHVARKPWSGWCSGIGISRFDSSALCFQSQGRLWMHWKNWETLLSCVLYTLYLPLLVSSRS